MIRSALRAVFNKLKSCRIVALHHVQSESTVLSNCVIATDKLQEFTRRHEKWVSAAQLSGCASVYDGGICVTIDDGLFDLYTVAYPLLSRQNIPFIAFISSDLLDTEGYITTAQLKEMAAHPLVTIGSHGATHRLLDTLSDEEQWYELAQSKKKLEAITGREIVYFAYSNGRFNKKTTALLKKAGYKQAFGVHPRLYNFASALSRWNLPRYNLTSDTVDRF